MTILLSIVGLGAIIFDPRARALPRSARARHASAALLHRLPAGRSGRRTESGIEYGIGAIPLGGFVKIPGCTGLRRSTWTWGSAASRRRAGPGVAHAAPEVGARSRRPRHRAGRRARPPGARRRGGASAARPGRRHARASTTSTTPSARTPTGAPPPGSVSRRSRQAPPRTSCSQSRSSRPLHDIGRQGDDDHRPRRRQFPGRRCRPSRRAIASRASTARRSRRQDLPRSSPAPRAAPHRRGRPRRRARRAAAHAAAGARRLVPARVRPRGRGPARSRPRRASPWRSPAR